MFQAQDSTSLKQEEQEAGAELRWGRGWRGAVGRSWQQVSKEKSGESRVGFPWVSEGHVVCQQPGGMTMTMRTPCVECSTKQTP